MQITVEQMPTIALSAVDVCKVPKLLTIYSFLVSPQVSKWALKLSLQRLPSSLSACCPIVN